jgi:hypothetical protein
LVAAIWRCGSHVQGNIAFVEMTVPGGVLQLYAAVIGRRNANLASRDD